MRGTYRRLDELLLAQATSGLSAAEAAELERLLAACPQVDADAYERVAAAVCLATIDTAEAMPDSLRAKLERQASAFIASTTARQR